MPFRLYVGNYPFTFTDDDVKNLFRDFDGLKVDKICRLEKKTKSFAFVNCKTMDQLVSVIKKMNRTLVSGRRLILRASDDSLQEYVNLILKNDDKSESSSSEPSFIPMQVMKNRRILEKDDSDKAELCDKFSACNIQCENNSASSSRSAHISYQKQDVSDLEKSPSNSRFHSKAMYPESSDTSSLTSNLSPNHSKNLINSNFDQTAKSNDIDVPENVPEFQEHFHSRSGQSQFNIGTNDTTSFSYKSDNSDISYDEDSEYFHHQYDNSSWVSVTNFRFGTPVKTFYRLFTDYNPLTVRMICNQPTLDRNLTEAHVCFESKEIADDVIFNFDNTIFQGRIILVNDVDDLTMMNELLTVSCS